MSEIRDAVKLYEKKMKGSIAVEKDAEGMVETIDRVLDNLIAMSGADECGPSGRVCEYESDTLKAREDYVFTKVDTCGSDGVSIVDASADFNACCGVVRECYSTCHLTSFEKGRDECNSKFLQCLTDACENDFVDHESVREYKSCKKNAKALHKVADALGCVSYIQGQEAACECIPAQREIEDGAAATEAGLDEDIVEVEEVVENVDAEHEL